MRSCLLVLVLILFTTCLNSFGQDPQLLQRQYQAATAYKEKIYALDALANYYTWTIGGLEQARVYGRQMISLAAESQSKELEALAYHLNGLRLVEAVGTSEKEKELRTYFAKVIQLGKENNLPYYEACAYIGLSGIQFHLVVADGDEMLAWGKKALALSSTIGNDSLQAMSLVTVAIGQQIKNDNISAFHHFTDAIALAEKIKAPYLLAYCYRAFARFYDSIRDHDKALVYYAKAMATLKQKRKLNYRDLHWLFMTQWNITWAYNDKKEIKKARESANRLIELSEQHNLPTSYRIAPFNQHLYLYISEGKYKEAELLLKNNPELASWFKSHDYETGLFSLKASIYRHTGQYDSADYYYRQNLAAIDQSLPGWSAGVYGEYGNFLLERGRLAEAIKHLEIAKNRAEQHKLLNYLVTFYQDLEKAYYRAGNTEKAYSYLSLFVQGKDSLAQLSREKDLALLQVQQEQKRLEQEQHEKQMIADYRNRVRTLALAGGLVALFIVALVLLRNNRQKLQANNLLQKQKQETEAQKQKAEHALEELKSAQAQLVQKEKMASLGELTAGIAHEIQNPLNFVNNFSEANKELIEELQVEAVKGNVQEIIALAADIRENAEKITHHGRRADAIVKSMLEHSRLSKGEKQLTNINTLAEEYLKLAYHGCRAKDHTFTAILETHFDPAIGQIELIPQDIGRVLLNLFNNAFYAVSEKKKAAGEGYESIVQVTTQRTNGRVEIKVKDNGTGIPEKVLDKIYQPFFTTKPTGEGTGLGLSLSYDIITKGHGGNLSVHAKEGQGAEFVIELPAASSTE